MEKTKSNGHAGPATPAPHIPAPAVDPPPDPSVRLASLVAGALVAREKAGYFAGFKRAARVIAIAVGKLDGESKSTISKVVDQLEAELHQAEQDFIQAASK